MRSRLVATIVFGVMMLTLPGAAKPGSNQMSSRTVGECVTHSADGQVLEFLGGGVDPDPVGVEWYTTLDGNVIGYGPAPTVEIGWNRAAMIGNRNELCITVTEADARDDPLPPNLCYTHVTDDTVLWWIPGDPVGIMWWTEDSDGHVIGYGSADTLYQGLVKAGQIAGRNWSCATYQDKDMELPW